jgi:hypothetical protein
MQIDNRHEAQEVLDCEVFDNFTRTIARVFRPRSVFIVSAVVALLLSENALTDDAKNAGRVQPYAKNLRCWQYRGEPLMLLEASKTGLHSWG